MKVKLNSGTTIAGSFIDLARVIEEHSELGVTESIELAKRVIYENDNVIDSSAAVFRLNEASEYESVCKSFKVYGVDVSEMPD